MREAKDAVPGGSGPSDRALDGVQAVAGGGGQGFMRAGEVSFGRGMECAAGEVSGHGVRRYSWAVPRSHRAVPDRRESSRNQLSLYGRLCGWVW